MVFSNEAQLKSFLLKKSKRALEKSCQKVYKIIDGFVKEFYSDYKPELYIRTKQLYNSLVVSEIVQVGNGFEACVYFNYSGLNYDGVSGLDVIKAAGEGLHGADGSTVMYGKTGVSIWNDPMSKMNINEILKERLIAEGVPIR